MFLCVTYYMLSICNRVSAQQADHWHRVGQRAMPSQQINAIAQDQDGYLWIGTDGGLLRYDGHDFVIYSSGNDNSQGLRGNIIEQVIVDADNTVWLAVKGRGLQRYNRILHQFETIEPIAGPFGQISQIEERGDELWITIIDSDVIKLNRHDLSIATWSLGEYGIISHCAISPEKIIASSQGAGVQVLTRAKDGSIKSNYLEFEAPYQHFTKSNTFIQYCHVNEGLFAGGWDNAIHQISIDERSIKSYVFPSEQSLQYSSDEILFLEKYKEKLWIGTKFGHIYSFDPKSKSFEQQTTEGLPLVKFTCFMECSDGSVWLGTDNGLFVLRPMDNNIKFIELPDETMIQTQKCIDNYIYLGTNHGLYRLDTSKNSLDHCVKNQSIHSLEQWTENKIILGTDRTLLVYYCDQNKVQPLLAGEFIEPYPDYLDPRNIEFSRYNDILITDTMIYASAYGHAIVFCPTDQRYFGYYKQLDSLKEHLVNKLYESQLHGLILLGNDFGLHVGVHEAFSECESDTAFETWPHIEKTRPNFVNLKASKSFNMSTHYEIQANEFYDVLEDARGTLLAASRDGLYTIDVDKGTVERIDIPVSRIDGILADKHGGIWGIAHSSLFYWNAERSFFGKFDESDGIPSASLKGQMICDNKDQLYVNAGQSIMTFSPDRLLRQSHAKRPIRFTSLRILRTNRYMTPDSSISIHERDNSFSLKFSAFPFGSEHAINYQYRIHDDDPWSMNEANNELIVSNLSPGNYRFGIRAVDKNGLALTNERFLNICVRPFWYNSIAFFVCSFLALGSGLFFLVRFILNQQRKVMRVRREIAQDLHDDIGSTLGSISIYSAAAKQRMETGADREAADIIERIGENSRLMIEKMSDIVWSVNTENESIGGLISKMEEFARNVFTAQDIKFDFRLDDSVQDFKVDMIKRKNIYLIFKEIVHNVIKHAEAKKIQMQVFQDKSRIVISLQDDGIGFETDASFKGNGLNNMQRRAKKIRGMIEINSKIGEGTCVVLLF